MLFADWNRVCSVSILVGMLWDPKAMTKLTLSLCQSLSLIPASSGLHFSWAFTGVIGRREPSSQTIVCTEIVSLFSSKWNNVLPAPNESSCLLPPFSREAMPHRNSPSLFVNALSRVFVQRKLSTAKILWTNPSQGMVGIPYTLSSNFLYEIFQWPLDDFLSNKCFESQVHLFLSIPDYTKGAHKNKIQQQNNHR